MYSSAPTPMEKHPPLHAALKQRTTAAPNRQPALAIIRKEDLTIETLCKLNILITPCLDIISEHGHVLEGDLRYLDELTLDHCGD